MSPKHSLKGFVVLTILIVLIANPSQHANAQNPSVNIDALIANANKANDSQSVTRLKNLRFALATLKPSDLRGINCGKDKKGIVVNVPEAEDVAGKLLEKALERYLPTLAAALQSTPAAAFAAFLTSTPIGSDSVEILNQSDKRPSSEVRSAARQMLQDTTTDNFQKLDRRFMAKIVGCAI